LFHFIDTNPIWIFLEKVGEFRAKYKERDKRYSLGSDQPEFQTD